MAPQGEKSASGQAVSDPTPDAGQVGAADETHDQPGGESPSSGPTIEPAPQAGQGGVNEQPRRLAKRVSAL
jgi:hypothetical protein